MSYIYTTDNCIGCNKCIKVCPYLGASIIKIKNGIERVEVNPDACVTCGACRDVCRYNARQYDDDLNRLLEDLKKGVEVGVMFTPALMIHYPKEYMQIFGALNRLGVNMFFSGTSGVPIFKWAMINYMHDHNMYGGIANSCTATEEIISKHFPKLLSRIVPVHNPLMCTAIYMKKHLKFRGNIAYIGTCIGKNEDVKNPATKDYVHYNVTFEKLYEYLKSNNMLKESYTGKIHPGAESPVNFPFTIEETLGAYFSKDSRVKEVQGEKNVYDFIKNHEEEIYKNEYGYALYELINCNMQCRYGNGADRKNISLEIIEKRSKDAAAIMAKENSDKLLKNPLATYKTMHSKSPEENIRTMNEAFRKAGININDYFTTFKDKSNKAKVKEPTASEKEEVYKLLYKFDKKDRMLDCGGCGYETCETMVKAVYNNIVPKENCVFYVKSKMQEDKEHLETMASNLENEKEFIKENRKNLENAIIEINDEFAMLHEALDNMTKDNESNSSDTNEIAIEVSNMSDSCIELENAIKSINDLLKDLENNNKEVVSIASKTNLLSLNASIEAARAGESGRGFGVVASEISVLAENSKNTASKSNASQQNIQKNIEVVLGVAEKLMEVVTNVNGKTQTLAATTETITAATENIAAISENIKEKLEVLKSKRRY